MKILGYTDLAKTAHTAARAFKNFAWAVFQLKYGFPREFSDN